jgi:acyl carrier protein
MTSATLEQVQAIVARIAGAHRSLAGVGPDTPLTEGGLWLDSVHLLETIIECEEAFDLVFDPETDFTDQTLRTVRTLFDLIRATLLRLGR